MCRKYYSTMKKSIFIIGFLAISVYISSEDHCFREAMHPVVWVRPDTGLISPSICDTISATPKYTMMMVYKTLQPDVAQQLWKIFRPDSAFYVISTHGLYTEAIPLPNKDKQTPLSIQPCIYTIQHNMTSDTTHKDNYQLHIGSDTRTDSTRILLYEAAYFPRCLSRKQLLIFQTYLALKHGITLNKADYLSAIGDTLWNARTDKGYYHHIKGIGSDSVYEFYSQKSSSLEDDVVSISCVDTLPYNSYALLGDDNAELEWYAYENTTSMLQRTWKIKTTNNQQPIIICLNCDKVGDFTDTLHLALLNEEGEITQTIFPDSIDINKQYYYTIVPSLKQLYFSFTSTSETHNYSRKRNKGNHSSSQTNHDEGTLISDIKITLGPNPTYGEYSLNISLSQPTNILFTIQDPTGKTIVQQKLTDSSMYQYSGYLYSNGLYLFSFYSDNGRILSTQELLVY